MINCAVMFNLPDLNDLPVWERWYLRNHAPEVMARFQPWQTRYVSYRAVPTPVETEKFGVFNYRYTQTWFSELPGNPTDALSFDMPQNETRENRVISFNLPPQATEEFCGGEATPDDLSILRWINVIKYPDGVSAEEADAWYLEVHAKEIMEQPGITRFFSYKCIPATGPLPGWKATKEMATAPPPPQWHRVSELWYANYDAWRDSVLINPPSYTKPGWATQDSYPFLVPYEDFVSMFILESPSNDFHRELRPYV